MVRGYLPYVKGWGAQDLQIFFPTVAFRSNFNGRGDVLGIFEHFRSTFFKKVFGGLGGFRKVRAANFRQKHSGGSRVMTKKHIFLQECEYICLS